MKKSYVLVGILSVAIVALIGYIGFKNLNDGKDILDSKAPIAESYLTISINPEIELALDSQDKVVEVIPVNADADVLTSDLDLVGLTVEEASDKIIDSAIDTGYLDEYSDENTIVVTTINDNEEKRAALQNKIMTRFNTKFEERKIYPVLVAKGLDDNLKAEADQYGISYGKMLLIETAVTLNNELSKDELVTMSVRDIQIEIRTYVKDRRATYKQSVQDAKAEWKEKKAELKQEYINKVQELRTNISEEHKEEFKNMTPTQKKEAINNYLNAKREAIKNNINAIKEEIKSEIKEDMKNYNYPVLKNNADTIKNNIKERIQQRKNNK